jgi:uncharacterized protein (TIGR02588 family)
VAQKEQPDRTPRDIPMIEWIAAGIGAVVVVGLLTLLLIKAVHWQASAPPMMHVEPQRVVAGTGGYILEVRVVNAADNTGANVQVEGTLKRGGSDVETSNAMVAYVPGHAHVKAGLQFSRDPRQYEMQLRITGYEEP